MPWFGRVFIPKERLEIQHLRDKLETRSALQLLAIVVIIAAAAYWYFFA